MWADLYVDKLKQGETVSFRPKGNSMSGKISSGQLVTVRPIEADEELKKGDIVLCKVKGNQYLHLITALNKEQFQISNNKGFVNGWISVNQIYGKLISVND